MTHEARRPEQFCYWCGATDQVFEDKHIEGRLSCHACNGDAKRREEYNAKRKAKADKRAASKAKPDMPTAFSKRRHHNVRRAA